MKDILHRSRAIALIAALAACSGSDSTGGQAQSIAEPKAPSDKFAVPVYAPVNGTGRGVKVEGTIARGSVSMSGNSIRTWKVVVTVSNYTGKPVRFGESMVVLEKAPQIDDLIGIYVIRESEHPTAHFPSLATRYGLLWGLSVDTVVSALWPIGALPGGAGNVNAFLLMLGMQAVKPYFPGGGYPPVGPGRQVVFSEEVLMPLKNEPTSVLLLPPPAIEDGKQPAQTVLRFDPADTSQKVIRSLDATRYAFDEASTATLANDAAQPGWLRLHALNWAAESRFAAVAADLMRIAADENVSTQLRATAMLNLALHHHTAATPIILDRLSVARDTAERGVAVAALGEMGDPAVAVSIRPLLGAGDLLTYRAATALGKLRDTAAVAPLLAQLKNDKANEVAPALAGALVAIGTPAVWDGFVAVSRNRQLTFAARTESIEALGKAKRSGALPALLAIAADNSDTDGVRMRALTALGEIGGAEAWAAIRATTDSHNTSVALSAVETLARSKDSSNAAFIADIARKPRHPMRVHAIQQIGYQNITTAEPALFAILRDPATASDVLPEAIDALAKLGRTVGESDLAIVWSAYQREKDSGTGYHLATVLIAGKFADKTAIPVLIAGLDENRNQLWFENVRLLRLLTSQTFGPEASYSGDEKSRKADLDQWRAWWAQQAK